MITKHIQQQYPAAGNCDLGIANRNGILNLRSDIQPQKIDSLSTVPSFAKLEPSIVVALSQIVLLHSFDAGQIVYWEGEPSSGYYIVQEGWLKSAKISSSGREQIIRFMGPGEVFNEVGLFGEGLNQTTIEALEPAKVWIIQRDPLIRLLEKHPPLAQTITQNMAKRVVRLISLVENLSLQPVVARLARMFLNHSTSDVLNRRRWSTQAAMAARLGTVPDVINRVLNSLAEEGLIELERTQIRILDRKGLERKTMLDD